MATLKSWAEVQASPEFRNMTPAQQQDAARAYEMAVSVDAQAIAREQAARRSASTAGQPNAQGQQTGLLANVGASWNEFQAGLQTTAADITQQNDLPHMTAYLSRLAENNKREASKIGYTIEDFSAVQSPTDYLYGGLERVARSTAPIVVNKIPVFGQVLAGASMYGNLLDQQKENLGEVNRPRAVIGAVGSTLLDRIGMKATGLLGGSAARAAAQTTKALPPTLPVRAAYGLATESVTEGLQTGIEGVTVGETPDNIAANMQEAFLWGPATGGYMTIGGEASRAAFGGDLGSGDAAKALDARYENLRQNGNHADPISMNRARIAVDAYDAFRKDTGAGTLYSKEVAAKATAKIQELWEDTATANAARVADELIQAGGLLEHFMMPSEKRAKELGIEKSTLRSAMRGVQKATGIDLVNAIDEQYEKLKAIESSKYRDLQNLVAALDNRHRSLQETENTLRLRKAAGIADTAELAGVNKQLADIEVYKKQVAQDIAKANGLFEGRDKVNDPDFTIRDQQDIADLVARTGLDFLTAYQQHSTARAMREATNAERRKFYGSRNMAQAAVAGTVGYATGGASVGVGLLAGGIDKLSASRAKRRQKQVGPPDLARTPDSSELVADYGIVPDVTDEQIRARMDADESRAQQSRDRTAERKATEAASAPKFTQVDIDNFQDDISTKIYTWDATRDALLEQGMTPEHYNEFQKLQEEMDALQESEYTASHPNKLKNLAAKLASVRDRAKQDISENNRISTNKEQRDARAFAASEREKVRQRRERKTANRSYDTVYNDFLKTHADNLSPEQRSKLDQRLWYLQSAEMDDNSITPEQFKRELMDLAAEIKADADTASRAAQAEAKRQADAETEETFRKNRDLEADAYDSRYTEGNLEGVSEELQLRYLKVLDEFRSTTNAEEAKTVKRVLDTLWGIIKDSATRHASNQRLQQSRVDRESRKQEQEDKATEKKSEQAVAAKQRNSESVGKALNDFLSKEGKDLPEDVIQQLQQQSEELQGQEGIVSVESFRKSLIDVARAHRSQQTTLKLKEERSARDQVVAKEKDTLFAQLDSTDLGTDTVGLQRRQDISSLINGLRADMPKSIYNAMKAQIKTLMSTEAKDAKRDSRIRKLLDIQSSDFLDIEQGVSTPETQDKLETVLTLADPEAAIQSQLEQVEQDFRAQTLRKDAPEAIREYKRQLQQLETVKEALQESETPEQARERLSVILAQRERDMEATRKFRDVEEAEGYRSEETLGADIARAQEFWNAELQHALDLEYISRGRVKAIQDRIDQLIDIKDPSELKHQRNLISQEIFQAKQDKAETDKEQRANERKNKKPLGGNKRPKTGATSATTTESKTSTKTPVKAPPKKSEPAPESEVPATVEDAIQAVAETPVEPSTGVKAPDLAPPLRTDQTVPEVAPAETPTTNTEVNARSAYNQARNKGSEPISQAEIPPPPAVVPEDVLTVTEEQVPAGLEGIEPESRRYTAQDTVTAPEAPVSLEGDKRQKMDAKAKQAATRKVIEDKGQEIEQELEIFQEEAEANEPSLAAGELDIAAFERVDALMLPKRIALYEEAAGAAEQQAADGGTDSTPPEVWLEAASHWRKLAEDSRSDAESGIPSVAEVESAVEIIDEYAPTLASTESPVVDVLTTETSLPARPEAPTVAEPEVASEVMPAAPSLPTRQQMERPNTPTEPDSAPSEVEEASESLVLAEDADTLEEMGYDPEVGNVDADGEPVASVVDTLETIEKAEGLKKEDQFLTKADKEALKRDEELNAENATDEDVFAGITMLQRAASIYKPVPIDKSPEERFPRLSEISVPKESYPGLFKKYKESVRDMSEDYLSHLPENDPVKQTIKDLLKVKFPSTKDGLIRSHGRLKAVKRLIITKLIKDAQNTKKGSKLFKTATGAPNTSARRSFITKFVATQDATETRELLSWLRRETGVKLYTGNRDFQSMDKASSTLARTRHNARMANLKAHRRLLGLDKPTSRSRKGALSK